MTTPKADKEMLLPLDLPAKAETLSNREAAQRAGVSRRTMQKWAQEGRVRRLATDQIDAASLECYLKQRRQVGSAVTAAPAAPASPREEPWQMLVTFFQQELALTRARAATLQHLLETLRGYVAEASETERPPAARPVMSPLPADPPPGTLLAQVLAVLRTADRPRLAWQIQQALHLDRRPHRELSKLVKRGLATRVKPGVYAPVPSSQPTDTPQGPSLSLREQVHQVVQQANRPLRAAEVREILQMARSPDRELGHLARYGKLKRVAPGLYTAPDAPREAGEHGAERR